MPTDMTFTNEGNKTYYDNMVNFEKMVSWICFFLLIATLKVIPLHSLWEHGAPLLCFRGKELDSKVASLAYQGVGGRGL
jgi:hypothetical protein